MADGNTRLGGGDRSRINVNEEHELHDWADRFGVSRGELIRAIEAVGSHVKSVELHLRVREAQSENAALI
jgi:hypothetical protein